MASIIFWFATGFGALVTVATLVAAVEHLRGRKQLRQQREVEMAAHAAATLAASFSAPPVALPAVKAVPASLPLPAPGPAAAQVQAPMALPARPLVVAGQRAALAGALRNMAKPAVGPPTSGWTETEPMVLDGPISRAPLRATGSAHFDPTESAQP